MEYMSERAQTLLGGPWSRYQTNWKQPQVCTR